MITGEILITGGCGALGHAVIHRATKEKWDCRITVYSRDVMKQHNIRNAYPNVSAIVGDVRDLTTLTNAMTGKDCVLHLAAQKHIPEAEYYSINNYEVNVMGSLNVCVAAMELRTPKVLAVSTDKACYSINAYGASKFMMEKIFAEYSRLGLETQFHLIRLGNVLESTGSVIQVWKNSIERGEKIKITDPAMTRFWLSPQQAVGLIINSLELQSGHIYVPRMKALSIGKLAAYVIGSGPDAGMENIPLRPGEKIHETLITIEEIQKAFVHPEYYDLYPTTSAFIQNRPRVKEGYTSDTAPELTRDELMELLRND